MAYYLTQLSPFCWLNVDLFIYILGRGLMTSNGTRVCVCVLGPDQWREPAPQQMAGD